MFWINVDTWPSILSASMNGENIKVLVNTSLDQPTGIAVDYQMNGRLYWCDEKTSSIETVKIDGSDRHIFHHNLLHNPYRLDIFENHIYWLTRMDGSVSKVDKFGRGAVTRLIEHLDLVDDIKVYHKYKYPARSESLSLVVQSYVS